MAEAAYGSLAISGRGWDEAVWSEGEEKDVCGG